MLCLQLYPFAHSPFFKMPSYDASSSQVAGLKSLAGMISNQCFNPEALFHVLKAMRLGLADEKIHDKSKYLSWLHSLLQEACYQVINNTHQFMILERDDTLHLQLLVKTN
jgi:hypothetical protein